MPDKDPNAFPEINLHMEEEEVKPVAQEVPLHELSKQQRIDRQIAVIEQFHPHIAKGLKLMWNYRECVEYMEKLVLSGGDGAGKSRVGFRVEVLSALMDLTSLHEITKK